MWCFPAMLYHTGPSLLVLFAGCWNLTNSNWQIQNTCRRVNCSLNWSYISYGEINPTLFFLRQWHCEFFGNKFCNGLTVLRLFCIIGTLWSGKTTVSVLHMNPIRFPVGSILSCFHKSNLSSSVSWWEQNSRSFSVFRTELWLEN